MVRTGTRMTPARFVCHLSRRFKPMPLLTELGESSNSGSTEMSSLVCCSRIGWAFAAMDFWIRRGVSDEHTPCGSERSEQRSLNQKDMPPKGLRRIWLLASLLLSRRSTRDILHRRASPEAKCGATNAHPIREQHTRGTERRCVRESLKPKVLRLNQAPFRTDTCAVRGGGGERERMTVDWGREWGILLVV
jgi:hypothetical protein